MPLNFTASSLHYLKHVLSSLIHCTDYWIMITSLESAGLDDTLRSSPHPHLSSHPQSNQSHPGSDSEYHSVLLSTIGSRVQSLQQIQSVDV